MTEILNQLTESEEIELIAHAMAKHNGNLNLVSREKSVRFNVMALRIFVRENPEVRVKYQQLLTYKLQEAGLHISERILKFSKLQDEAFGDVERDIPADPKAAIDISKHISELIRESKKINVSKDATVVMVSSADASELLQNFLDT